MFGVRLGYETDFEGWRAAARALRLAEVAPEQVLWTVGNGLFNTDAPPKAPAGARFAASRAFIDLAGDVILHRAPERLELLYRLLWRLREQPRLLEIVTDADVRSAERLRRQVRDAEHRMHAFLRFRRVDAAEGVPETYVSWFEPAHRVTERAAAYFVDRMANLRFSILTPDVCAHWDGASLGFTPGAERGEAPSADALEDDWRTYFGAVFNPARLNPALMVQHMPRRYWRNLPEAQAIAQLVQQAQERTTAMVQSPPSEPSARMRSRSPPALAPPDETGAPPETIEAVAAAIQGCRRCALWRDATQGVPGEGPRRAALMFVGEQPGDAEDLRGKPFVGPAGQLLDRALAQAGVPREQTYVTNAVKHFKWEPRGKRRLHKKPDGGEISACRWWLQTERRLVQPQVIVALGATAAVSVFGRPVSVTRERGPAGEVEGGAMGFVTVHPSYLLRLPDEAAKAAEFERFVRDLGQAYALVEAA